jgi:hypothetical protein
VILFCLCLWWYSGGVTFSIVKKQYLIAAGVFLLLVIINIVVFLFLLRPGVPPNTFGGKVSAVTNESLSISDAHGRTTLFTLASSTKVVFGKNIATITDLTPGVFVMVSIKSPEPYATATKIRIMSTDPFNRPHKPATP